MNYAWAYAGTNIWCSSCWSTVNIAYTTESSVVGEQTPKNQYLTQNIYFQIIIRVPYPEMILKFLLRQE